MTLKRDFLVKKNAEIPKIIIFCILSLILRLIARFSQTVKNFVQ